MTESVEHIYVAILGFTLKENVLAETVTGSTHTGIIIHICYSVVAIHVDTGMFKLTKVLVVFGGLMFCYYIYN